MYKCKLVDLTSRQPNIMTIIKFIKVLTFCVELCFSPNAKCYKMLIIVFLAKYRLGEADAARKKNVSSSNTSIISPDSLIL